MSKGAGLQGAGFALSVPEPLTAGLSSRPEDDDFDMEEELKKLRPPRQPEMEPRSRRGLVGDLRVGVIHEGHGDSEESDSDGSVRYRDEDEDEDDVPISETRLLGTCWGRGGWYPR